MADEQRGLDTLIERFTFADAAARTGATGLFNQDIGKIAYQTDTGIYYRLTSLSPLTWAVVAPAATKITILTSGTTWSPTAGCRAFWAECVGGGGGGAAANGGPSAASCCSGGGGGGYAAKYYSGVLAASYTCAIGAGGATDTAGGDTKFDGTTNVYAVGGTQGSFMSNGTAITVLAGGAGGGATFGTLRIQGSDGGPGVRFSGTAGYGGQGGASGRGFGSANGVTVVAGVGAAGYLYGGGGGGALAFSSGVQNGGTGANGVIRIMEFF